MIQVCELAKRFGETVALAGVSFVAQPGQILGLLGPNGAGKSTLMRILSGYLSPTSGQAFVAGKDATSGSLEARSSLGYLPENSRLYPEMRVQEYLLHRAALKKITPASRAEAIDSTLEACGLVEVRRRIVGQLSKGFRQRLGLSAALLGDPPVLVLDEPTVGLDPLQMREIRELVRRIGRERTVLFSTHVLPEAEALCDRVVILDDGRKLLDSPVRDLRSGSADTWIELEVAPPADAAIDAMNTVAGVTAEVLQNHPTVRLRLRPVERPLDIELRSEISSALTGSGRIILGLNLRTPSLDDTFARLTG